MEEKDARTRARIWNCTMKLVNAPRVTVKSSMKVTGHPGHRAVKHVERVPGRGIGIASVP